MSQKIKVFKFGGASVKDADAINNVIEILRSHKNERILIVVSAMGKTTNKMEKIVHAINDRDKALELLQEVKDAHYEIIKELFDEPSDLATTLNDIFVEVEWALDEVDAPYDFVYDQIVGIGELVSTRILNHGLKQAGISSTWLDARGIIKTDELFREAAILWDKTITNINESVKPKLTEHNFVVTQGFIGSTTDNNTTTLGREGSDFSAAIFSFGLDADSMTIWKDVPGVLTADPRKFDNVTKLNRLAYKEAIEMTYYGAKVIHPKTIKPLQNKTIPLHVKSFLHPEEPGTLISAEIEENYPPIVSIEDNQTIIYISTKDFSFVAEHHLGLLFQKLAQFRLTVNMMQNTAISFAVCVTDKENRIEDFCKSIDEEFNTTFDKGLELITIRHYQKTLIENLKKGKLIFLEQRIKNTVQLVVKSFQMMQRKK